MEFSIIRREAATRHYYTLAQGSGWSEFDFLYDWVGSNRNGELCKLNSESIAELITMASMQVKENEEKGQFLCDNDLHFSGGEIVTASAFILFLSSVESYANLRREFIKGDDSEYFICVEW